MKNRFRNTVLFIAGSIVVAALLGAPSGARAAVNAQIGIVSESS
jgi:hypothetical protein